MNGAIFVPYGIPLPQIGGRFREVGRYTYTSSHQTRQRMKARENVKRRMDMLYLLIPTTKQNQEDRWDR